MGMIYQVGSDRQPGRLLRECRWERVLWDGASKDVIADTGLVVVVMWSVVSWICPVPRSVVAARGQIGQSVGALMSSNIFFVARVAMVVNTVILSDFPVVTSKLRIKSTMLGIT